MKKYRTLAMTSLLAVVFSLGGYWIVVPINENDYDSIMPIIINENSVCDYDDKTGYLVSKDSEIYLRTIKHFRWSVIEKEDLEKYMDEHKVDYCFYGYVKLNNKVKYTEVKIHNWMHASRRFTGEFLCGGVTTYYVQRRFPSLLNLIFGKYAIKKGVTIVS